jgi:carbon-monoxide dehydrogenase small subunit
MQLKQDFLINRPADEVWAFFHDIPALAACLPGAEYIGPTEDGRHSGKLTSKIGPFQASFAGEASVTYDEAARTIALDGKGVDKKGNSRGKMTMVCTVTPAAGGTAVAAESDVQLSGAIAQFGRTGIIAEVSNVLVADFVRNVEARLNATAAAAVAAAPTPVSTPGAEAVMPAPPPRAAPVAPARPIGGFRLFFLALKGWFRNLFGARSTSL